MLTSRSAAPIHLDGELVAHIALGPLDRDASRQVVRSLAGRHRLHLATLGEIVDRAGGVPLHIGALTRAVVDQPDTAAVVPVSLYDSLMSVLDRLGPARPLAQRLSVLGPSFDPEDIAYVAGDVAPAEVHAHLGVMLEAGVLRLDDGRYRFSNLLVAEAAYGSLLNADRIALHATIASAMAPSSIGSAPERWAFHLEAAGRHFDAAVAYRRASAGAIHRARHHEAQEHARRALTLLDRLGPDAQPDGGTTRGRALTNLAVGLQATQHGTEDLLAVVAEARRCGVGADDIAKRLLLDVIDVSNLQARGQHVAAAEVARGSVDAAESAGHTPSISLAHHFLGASMVWRGDLAGGVAELERAAEFWDRERKPGLEDGRVVGAMWSLLGLAACFADRPDETARLLRRARAAVAEGDGFGMCLVTSTGAITDQLAGRPATVRADLEPVWTLAVDLASDYWFNWAQALLGWAIAADDPAGLAMMAEVVDESSTRQTKPYFAYLLGSRLGEHGRVRDGLRRLDDGLAIADETAERPWVPIIQLARARWLAADGDHLGARAASDAAVAQASATGQHLVLRWRHDWKH